MYHLLIVDDEASERFLFRYLLKNFYNEITISEASNGKEALDILRSTHHDIIISDIQMPYINGVELATKARELFPDIEIIFISGYDDFSYVQNALLLKAANYILKPVNQLTFHKTINDILNRLDGMSPEYIRSKQSAERNFNDLAENICSSSSSLQSSPEEDDHALLQKISSAVTVKKPELLTESFYRLMQKYIHQNDLSHIYIRYVCTALLQILTSRGQAFSRDDFDQAAEKIHSFRHFSDIYYLLEEYLQRAVDAMQQNMEASHYAIDKVKAYIQEHYAESLSLNQLADLVYLSPNYLSNIFAKSTGVNINKYIRHVRMEKASALLSDTNMKISDISGKVGYPNTSYFCKLFQEEFGISPEKFRNTNLKHTTGKNIL